MAILLGLLRDHGLTLDPGPRGPAARRSPDGWTRAGADFGNARAMRDLADELNDTLGRRAGAAGEPPAGTASHSRRCDRSTSRPRPRRLEELLARARRHGRPRPVKETDPGPGGQVLALRRQRRRAASSPPHMLFVGPPGHRQDDRGPAASAGSGTARGLLTRPRRRGHPGRPRRGLRRPDRAQDAGAVRSRRSAGCCSSTRRTASCRERAPRLRQEAIDTLVTRDGGPARAASWSSPPATRAPMDDFLADNHGLRSRFDERVEFPAVRRAGPNWPRSSGLRADTRDTPFPAAASEGHGLAG